MSNERTIFTRLGILQRQDAKVLIQMKNKKTPTIVAKVGDFLFDENDSKVTLLRCEETVFPNDENGKQEQYITYLKTIKQVDRFEE